MALTMRTQNHRSVATDLGIEKLACQCVRLHPRLYSVSEVIAFDKEGQTLIVRGEVPTFYLKQLLQETLRALPGVARVDNQVNVTPRQKQV
jgi:hypothetical protein